MNPFHDITAILRGGSPHIRHHLLRDLLIVILLTAGLAFGSVLFIENKIKERIAGIFIRDTSYVAAREFLRFFEPVESSLTLVRKWGQANLLNPSDVHAMNAKFIPMLELMPQVSAMMVADSVGGEYFLLKEGDAWLTRSLRKDSGGVTAVWRKWKGTNRIVKEWREKTDYDPRSRPWYRGASETDSIYWSDPYYFLTKKSTGITGSVKFQTDRKEPFVIGMDIMLADVFLYIAGLKPTVNGKTFLVTPAGKIFDPVSPVQEKTARQEHSVSAQDTPDTDDPVIAGIVKSWIGKNKPSGEPIEIGSGSTAWWAGFVPLREYTGSVLIGVAVPESDMVGNIRDKKYLTGVSLAFVLMTGFFLSFLLMRKYNRQLQQSGLKPRLDRDHFAENILSLIRQGEGATVEFKSTMRMNLKTGKTGKEIEIAWLKTAVAYMNTGGGIILIGVNDSGSVTGFDEDGFENEDKCRLHFKNLINQHIGVEFSRYVVMDIVPIEDKKIVVVECDVALQPVFLMISKDDEAFYVRSGPSSIKLLPSKILKYMEARKSE